MLVLTRRNGDALALRYAGQRVEVVFRNAGLTVPFGLPVGVTVDYLEDGGLRLTWPDGTEAALTLQPNCYGQRRRVAVDAPRCVTVVRGELEGIDAGVRLAMRGRG